MSSDYANLLEEALEAWEGVRRGVIAEAEAIPADRYDFRPRPEARSVAELLRHVVETGLMMAGELSAPQGDFRRQSFPDFMQEYAGHLPPDPDRDTLLALLNSTFEEGMRKLRDAGELHMLQFIRRFDGKPGTRLAWLNHGVAHEYYHQGQLALYARLMGLVPALTRRIYGEG
jgi:uncharacterized damage-inducible protein DinB